MSEGTVIVRAGPNTYGPFVDANQALRWIDIHEYSLASDAVITRMAPPDVFGEDWDKPKPPSDDDIPC